MTLMATSLHEEDVLVAEHAHIKPLRRSFEAPRLQFNQRAFYAAILKRREMDLQQAQARGWLPPTEQLVELPAFQRARLIDEAGPDAEGEGPMDMGEVLRRREEREAARLAAEEAARAAAAAAAEARRARREQEREEREARRRQRRAERERRQEEKVLRQQDRLLEKKEQKAKRRAELERRHAAQVKAWEEQVLEARRQVEEVAAERAGLAERMGKAEGRLATLMEEKHAMVLQLKQALQAEEEQRQREAALAALEEGEMMPSPPQASPWAGLQPPWAAAAVAGGGPDAAAGAPGGVGLVGARSASLLYPSAELRSPGGSFMYGTGSNNLSGPGLAGQAAERSLSGFLPPPPPPPPPQRAASFGAGAGGHFSSPAGPAALAAGAGGSLPYASPHARPGLAEGRSGTYFNRGEEDWGRGGAAPAAGRPYARGESGGFEGSLASGGGSGMWSPRSTGGFGSPREPGGPPFGGPPAERPPLRCYTCGEPGHLARECPQNRGGGAGPAGTPQSAGGGPPGPFGAPPPYRGYSGGGGSAPPMTYEQRQRDREMRGLLGSGGYGRREGEGGPGGSAGPIDSRRGDREGRDGFARGFSGRGEER